MPPPIEVPLAVITTTIKELTSKVKWDNLTHCHVGKSNLEKLLFSKSTLVAAINKHRKETRTEVIFVSLFV